MAFNSYDSILAAISAGNSQEVQFGKLWPVNPVAAVIYSSWLFTGQTAAGTLAGAGGTTAATLVTCNSNTVGAIPIVSPTSASATFPYILSAGAMSTLSLSGTIMLIDRIADSGVLTTASGATCTMTMPAGGVWARYPSGVGVQAFMEGQAAAPTATAVVAMSYTNTVPTAGRIPSPVTLTAVAYKVFGSGANAPTGSPFFLLQGNDQGIASVQNTSMTVAAAANVALVICKPLLIIPCTTALFYTERDCVIQTPKLPKLPVTTDASACLQWLFFPNAAPTTPTILGSVTLVTG